MIGIITWRLKSGENLNFAKPVNPLKSLLNGKDEVVTLSAALTKTPVAVVKSDKTIWTSMVFGRDFKLIFDGEYLYTEWVI